MEVLSVVGADAYAFQMPNNFFDNGAQIVGIYENDMIDKLTLNYNRARQADITKELIEIISGAEAV